ncbi:MAG: hypothetical protein LRZ85_06010 [Alphaproteobacteria bacterium]|nr:hypothetical protein [Alphaproteobacteria bacterium]MCD8570411.1 hypothetical protein [Alphaproteobacteria bacterium]
MKHTKHDRHKAEEDIRHLHGRHSDEKREKPWAFDDDHSARHHGKGISESPQEIASRQASISEKAETEYKTDISLKFTGTDAGYHNTLGYYVVAADGTLKSAQILFSDVHQVTAGTQQTLNSAAMAPTRSTAIAVTILSSAAMARIYYSAAAEQIRSSLPIRIPLTEFAISSSTTVTRLIFQTF